MSVQVEPETSYVGMGSESQLSDAITTHHSSRRYVNFAQKVHQKHIPGTT